MDLVFLLFVLSSSVDGVKCYCEFGIGVGFDVYFEGFGYVVILGDLQGDIVG